MSHSETPVINHTEEFIKDSYDRTRAFVEETKQKLRLHEFTQPQPRRFWRAAYDISYTFMGGVLPWLSLIPGLQPLILLQYMCIFPQSFLRQRGMLGSLSLSDFVGAILLVGGGFASCIFLPTVTISIGIASTIYYLPYSIGKILKVSHLTNNIVYRAFKTFVDEWHFQKLIGFWALAAGVFAYLSYKKKNNIKFQAFSRNIDKEGLSVDMIAKLTSSGIVAGGLISSLFTLGMDFDSKELMFPKAIAELVRVIGDLVSSLGLFDESEEIMREKRDNAELEKKQTKENLTYGEAFYKYQGKVDDDPTGRQSQFLTDLANTSLDEQDYRRIIMMFGEVNNESLMVYVRNVDAYRKVAINGNLTLQQEKCAKKEACAADSSSSSSDSDDDDDELGDGFVKKIKTVKDKCQTIWKTRLMGLGIVTAAVLVGVVVFLFVHHRKSLRKFMLDKKKMVFKPKGRVTFQERVLEAKGKTKSGRGRLAQLSKPADTKFKKRKSYIIYDEGDIRDIFEYDEEGNEYEVYANDVASDGSLRNGTYRIVRYDFDAEEFFNEFVTVDRSWTYDASNIAYPKFAGNKRWNDEFDFRDNAQLRDQMESMKETLKNMNEVVTKHLLIIPEKKIEDKKKMPVDPVPEAKKSKKKKKKASSVKEVVEQPKESLTNASTPVKHQIKEVMGEAIDKSGDVEKFVCNVLFSVHGVLINKHAYEQSTHIKYANRLFPLPKVRDFGNTPHSDIMLLQKVDGFPKGFSKANFDNAVVNQQVTIFTKDAHSSGAVKEFDTKLNQVRYTNSTQEGWCGGPAVDSNGRVVAIHFAAGNSKKDNLGIATGDKFQSWLFPAKLPKN